MTEFKDLGLAEPILRALGDEGYTNPTPIQRDAIPHLLQGRDLLGIAQTGTGKTAAFALPIIQHLASNRKRPPARGCRALILAPTRELAAQIAESVKTYSRHDKMSVAVVVGGVKAGPQIRALGRGVDVLVATPGRLLDHMGEGHARLDAAEIVVLDEADHMLDLGFLVPIRRILSTLPRQRQSLFFSATMPKEIGTLAREMLSDPVEVAVTPVATTAERVSQQVFLVEGPRKAGLLVELLGEGSAFGRTLVFTRTKRGADRVAERLEKAGIAAAAIHGNKSQNQRERALDSFRRGRTRVMVATDIAARGIDVDGVTHVVNFDLPNVPESYVHRIGRTARAGNEGAAISFCDREERSLLRDIEKLTRQRLPQIDRRTSPESEPEEPRRRAGGNHPGGRPQSQRPPRKFGGAGADHDGGNRRPTRRRPDDANRGAPGGGLRRGRRSGAQMDARDF